MLPAMVSRRGTGTNGRHPHVAHHCEPKSFSFSNRLVIGFVNPNLYFQI